MITVTTPILVKNVKPVQIFDWIKHLTPEKYRQWDPAAHTGKIKRPETIREGDKIFFEEFVDAYRIRFTWRVLKLVSPGSILMKAVFPYPVYLALTFTPVDNDTNVVHELRLGYDLKFAGAMMDYFVKRIVMPDKKIRAIKKHAMIEFTNLEKILSNH